MDNNKKKGGLVWAIIVLVIVVIGIILLVRNKPATTAKNTVPTEQTEDVSPGSVNLPGGGTSAPATLSYQKALEEYADRIIQVGPGCQATPSQMTFKNGTTVMIDNRSAATHTFKLGTSFSVKAYGFKIVKLSAPATPTTYLMDCDGQQNIATVTIQK